MALAVARLFNAKTSACSAKCQTVSQRAYRRPPATAAGMEQDRRMVVLATKAADAAVRSALKRFMRHATPKIGMRKDAIL